MNQNFGPMNSAMPFYSGYGNPNQDYYQRRLSELQNQIQNQQFPNQQFQQPQNAVSNQPICRTVTNSAEAVAYPIDPLNVYVFPNFNSGEIYVKQIGSNGSSVIQLYRLEQNPSPQVEATTGEQTQQVPDLATKITQLEARINSFEEKLNGISLEVHKEESVDTELKTSTKRGK